MHIHKASQISQVHDLFPDLLPGYVVRLLEHFSDDVETVIAALLEPENLPDDLQNQNLEHDEQYPSMDDPPDLAPRSTPPLLPQRKNIFDGDEFDRLHISSDKLHKGRKEIVDQPQSLNEQSRSKAAILAALAAFDADDDERDDTYDVGDVGGAVDNTLDSDERRNVQSGDKHEETLFRAWKANPEIFSRDSKTRISTTRRQLNEEVGMTNEQIEGWAIMMTKDPKMADRLQQKYSIDRTFRGTQRVIQSTKWQDSGSPSDSQDEGSNTPSDGRRVGQAGIRGPRIWNRGGGRGGGSTAGPGNPEATQLARKRKEQGRGRGGAHNRRDGRAKKIGRGMAGPSA
jgi:activating signal cointegrator complex subunit 2